MVRLMRVLFAPRLTCLAFLAIGCGDDLPTYPPVTIINIGANVGGSNSSPSNGPGSGGRGSEVPVGGDGAGGSDGMNTGGSGSGVNTLYPHCAEMWSEPLPEPETACDLDNLTDGGELKGDITSDKTLESGNFYTLKGSVRVMPGVTLTIPPCVKVIGENSTAVLAIRAGDLGDPFAACTYSGNKKPAPGGKLVAVGEPNAPIIFTSANPPGSRRRGDWGGLIMMGNARSNKATTGYRLAVEGLTKSECYGWHTDEFNAESSGELSYVRVEYASRQIGLDSETNGITFAGLGSGTKLSYIQASNSADDCFEFFGGTVNADHLIALNCDDDMFDTDEGFSGNLQFLFGRQWPTTTEGDSSGFESDTGLKDTGPFTPLTNTTVANFAICGAGPTDMDVRRPGAAFRAASEQVMVNGFITQFAAGAVRMATSQPKPSGGDIRAWDNPARGPRLYAADGDQASTLTMSEEPPDRFCGCFTDPPSPIGATTITGKAPSFGDKSATYVGAFKDSTPDSNWMRGAWVDWSSE